MMKLLRTVFPTLENRKRRPIARVLSSSQQEMLGYERLGKLMGKTADDIEEEYIEESRDEISEYFL